MQLVNGLPGVVTVVEHEAIPRLRDAQTARDLTRGEQHPPEELPMLHTRGGDVHERQPRHDEHMHRSLRRHVTKGDEFLGQVEIHNAALAIVNN